MLWTKHVASFPGQGSRRPQHPGVGPPKATNNTLSKARFTAAGTSAWVKCPGILGGLPLQDIFAVASVAGIRPAGKRQLCLAAGCHCSAAEKGVSLATRCSNAYPRRASAMPKVDTPVLNGVVNQEKIAAGVRLILEGLGEDPQREGLRETADRVARMYAELLQGLHEDPREHLTVVFDEQHDEMVLVKDVPFSSLCEHHLLPFHGWVHAAYIPRGKVVGLSKVARVIESFARPLQVQERMTSQIADLLMEELDAQGVGVVIEASHTCMTMRGIKKPGSLMVTSAMRGTFKSNQATRSEFLSLVLHHQPTS